MFPTLIALIMILLIVVYDPCYVEARVHSTKDTVKSYTDYIQHKSSKPSKQPTLDGDGAGVQIQIPVTISLPPLNIIKKELEDLFGGSFSEIFKKFVLKRLLSEYSDKILDNEHPNFQKLRQHNKAYLIYDESQGNDVTMKSDSDIPDAGKESTPSSVDSENIEERPLNYFRQKRETPSGGAMSNMKEVVPNKLTTKGSNTDDWAYREDESKMNSKVVLPEASSPAMNSNNKISEIVIERFDTRNHFENDPLKHFLGHRFSSLLQSRPTRGSLYNSGNEYPTFQSSQSYPPTSFDDLGLGTGAALEFSQGLEIEKRLGKLDSIFSALRLDSEECRKKITCEVSRMATKYSPLAEIIQQETRLNANIREMGRELLESSDGTRLLGYIEASTRGKDRYRQCDVYRFRCRKDVNQIIDMDALAVWKEVVGWLTVKVLANGR